MWGSNDNSFSAGAGGFVTTPSQYNSPAGDKAGQRVKRSTNMVPVAIRQLNECTDEALRIEDVEASVVTIVGLVTHVEVTSTKTSFTIEDQTGSIETINYTGGEENEAAVKQTLLQEGTYGRVVGSLRTQKGGSGSRYLIIYKATPVLDMNEVTCHGLEVLQVANKLKKLKEQEALRTGVGGAVAMGMNTSTTTSLMGGGSLGDSDNGAMSNTAGVVGLNANQNMVFRCIQSVKGEEGTHVSQVIQNLKNKMSEKDIRSTIEFLSGEGHIYSTVDDDHYKSTDW